MRRGRKQLELTFRPPRGRGGARPGAGRPRTSRNVAHTPRPRFDGSRTPLHVTVRMAPRVWNLRSQRGFACVARALGHERDRGELRVVQFSVQGNHLHLVVEAADREVLARRMQGFGVRLARAVNAMMRRRRGRVIGDRYHARVLSTPREVHRVLRYVLLNHAKHTRAASSTLRADRFSSAVHFRHFAQPVVVPASVGPPLIAPPKSWLLARGWLRLGPIDAATAPR